MSHDDDDMISIRKEDLRHLFDLAVDTPLLCSGSFDTDDVNVIRLAAGLIGADAEAVTPDEFIRDYPHRFKPVSWRLERDRVPTGHIGYNGAPETRPETEAEVMARLGQLPDQCMAGTYNRYCGRSASDPKHAQVS